MPNLVQYIVVNGDIVRKLNWPLGAVIAQCCHATTAVSHIYKDDDATVAYFNDIDNMHKVVLEVGTFSYSGVFCAHFFSNKLGLMFVSFSSGLF